MKIGTNVTQTQVNVDKSKDNVASTLDKISAVRALKGSDGANLQVADSLLNQLSELTQGVANANEAVGMYQIADGALSSVSESLTKLTELSVQNGSGALNSDQKSMLNSQVEALKSSMSSALSNASYNGKNVFQSGSFEVGQRAINVTLNSIATSDIDIADTKTLQNAIGSVNSARESIASSINEFSKAIETNLKTATKMQESESNLQNSDLAKNVNELELNKSLLNSSLYANSFNMQQLQKSVSSLLY
ncbi:MAG: flagellin [Campylobacterales bacterium]|nr:flagellin [Campylobacterales bacterium]